MRVWINSRAHPRTDGGYNEPLKGKPEFATHCFTPEELKKISLVGIPVDIEHNGEKTVIGKVVSEYLDHTGAKYAISYIDTDTKMGKYAHNLLKSGELNQVSTEHAVSEKISEDKKSVTVKKTYQFLTLTKKAGRTDDSCSVLCFMDDEELRKSENEIKEKIGTLLYIF